MGLPTIASTRVLSLETEARMASWYEINPSWKGHQQWEKVGGRLMRVVTQRSKKASQKVSMSHAKKRS